MASSFTTSNPHRGNQEKNAAQPISIAPAVRNRQAYWCNQALEPGVSAPLVKRLEQPVCHSARQPRLRAMHKLFTPAGRLSDQPAQERLPPRPRCRCATCGARKHQISRSGFLSLPCAGKHRLKPRYELWRSWSDVTVGPSYRPGRAQRYWAQERPPASGQGPTARGRAPASARGVASLAPEYESSVRGHAATAKISVLSQFGTGLRGRFGW